MAIARDLGTRKVIPTLLLSTSRISKREGWGQKHTSKGNDPEERNCQTVPSKPSLSTPGPQASFATAPTLYSRVDHYLYQSQSIRTCFQNKEREKHEKGVRTRRSKQHERVALPARGPWKGDVDQPDSRLCPRRDVDKSSRGRLRKTSFGICLFQWSWGVLNSESCHRPQQPRDKLSLLILREGSLKF